MSGDREADSAVVVALESFAVAVSSLPVSSSVPSPPDPSIGSRSGPFVLSVSSSEGWLVVVFAGDGVEADGSQNPLAFPVRFSGVFDVVLSEACSLAYAPPFPLVFAEVFVVFVAFVPSVPFPSACPNTGPAIAADATRTSTTVTTTDRRRTVTARLPSHRPVRSTR
jgi:hypothetical protein